MKKFTLTPDLSEDQNAIIVAFDSKWLEAIRTHSVSEVFRKMGPKRFSPEWMYAYFGKPVSAIAAKVQLSSLEFLPLADAVAFSKKSGLTEAEINSYAKDYNTLLVYHIKKVLPAKTPVSLATLSDEFGFWPSSNFVPLSSSGCVSLDKLMGL